MNLIPGLPDDMARKCLYQVSYEDFPTITSVCKSWKDELLSPEFLQLRRISGYSELVVVMLQSDRILTSCTLYDDPTHGITLGVPEKGKLCELPGSDSWSESSQIIGVGTDLVFIYRPRDQPSTPTSVHIYNFLSGKWSRGTDMPGVVRYQFRCLTDLKKTIYIFGGFDKDRKALNTMLAYDAADDKWISLPDMVVNNKPGLNRFLAQIGNGKIAVYGSMRVGPNYETVKETFNIGRWQWEQDPQVFTLPAASTTSKFLYFHNDSGMQILVNDDCSVNVPKGREWESVAKLPTKLEKICLVSAWQQQKVLVIGCEKEWEELSSYMMDLKTRTWMKVRVDDDITYPGSCCYFTF